MAKTKDTIVRILHVIKKEKDPMFEIPKRSQKKIAVADAFSESGYCEHNNDRWLRNSNDGTKPAAASTSAIHGEIADCTITTAAGHKSDRTKRGRIIRRTQKVPCNKLQLSAYTQFALHQDDRQVSQLSERSQLNIQWATLLFIFQQY